MSESEPGKPTASSLAPGAAKSVAAGDPSMEDILASIRRILAEEEAEPAPPSTDPVLQLDASMLVTEPGAVAPAPPPPAESAAEPSPPPPAVSAAPEPAMLVAPEAAAAAASSVGSLVRTLVAERSTLVHSGGPTLEDMVRSELRPLLKQWLDTYLPPLVERLVRAEIERVVGRAVP